MIILTNLNKHYDKHYEKLFKNFFNLMKNIKNFISYDCDYFEFKSFKDYAIKYFYRDNKLLSISYYNYSRELHNDDGPAYIQYYSSGEINYNKYYLNNKHSPYLRFIVENRKLVYNF